MNSNLQITLQLVTLPAFDKRNGPSYLSCKIQIRTTAPGRKRDINTMSVLPNKKISVCFVVVNKYTAAQTNPVIQRLKKLQSDIIRVDTTNKLCYFIVGQIGLYLCRLHI